MTKVKLAAAMACAAVLQVAAANKYQKFEWEKTTYVPFDAKTTVTLECPDPAAAQWLQAHYVEWYGASAPKVTSGATGLKPEAGDEAFGAQTCPECVKHPKDELLLKHLTGIAEFIRSRSARAMMWHDMLLDAGDPRWKGFIKFGSKATASILDRLPKDIVICDWQYCYSSVNKPLKEWPTMTYFKEKGLSVAGCAWTNYKAMTAMADHIVKIGGFGFIETTWHHLRGKDWESMYKGAGFAAWGSPVSHDVPFKHSLRLIGNDMKVKDYRDTGHLNNQVPPAWWAR